MEKKYTNKLINEKSPYLLQHSHNPVEWYPWGEEAFKKAKSENKPIFLSIGYSTCHWCHVMEHESFEDEEIASFMNKAFVNIKVDREERPDIDNIYMSVCQIVNGSGGWPLSIIMTPDRKPFFAGTYIPKVSRNGRLGMLDMAKRTLDIWKKNHNEILKSAEELTGHLNSPMFAPGGVVLDDNIFRKTYHELASSYDTENGGFGNKPKFPLAHNLTYLTRYAKLNPNSESVEIIEKTLEKMKLGGIYDHIGKGFHRYSTDEKWLVPHFEKMLYDQAMMIIAYSEAFALVKKEDYKNTVYEIADYLERVMKDNTGAYYSAEDADSEGEEGKFYLWTLDEIREVLAGNTEHFIKLFNIKNQGNYFDELTNDYTGKNILYLEQSISDYAEYNKIDLESLKNEFNSNLMKLFNEREKRIKPSKDDKILTDWNALIASAYVIAGRIFHDENLIEKSKSIIEFIKSKLYNGKHLFHLYKENEASVFGMIDDYAYTIRALLDLYDATFDLQFLEFALELQLIQKEEFYDEQEGGFFFTPKSGEILIARKKELYDGALPSGNSISYMNLNRLYKLTGNVMFSELADKTQKLFASQIMQSPSAYSQFIQGYGYNSSYSKEIVIVANDIQAAKPFIDYFRENNEPYASIILKTLENSKRLQKILGYTSEYSIENDVTVYICKNFACLKPVRSIEELKDMI